MEAAKGDTNLMHPILDAVKAYATLEKFWFFNKLN
jgi:hypothetical protein